LGIYVPGEVSSFSTDSNVILAIFVIKLKDPALDSIPEQGVPKVAAPGKSGILLFRFGHLPTSSMETWGC
jgi:hypothetical protein